MKLHDTSPESQIPPLKTKKKVQFADRNGLQLVFVKTITPCSSADDLTEEDFNNSRVKQLSRKHSDRCLSKYLVSRFIPPQFEVNFHERLHNQKVCLESVDASSSMITGIVSVENLAYEKEVKVRYTLNNWGSFQDIWADYVPLSRDGETDKFCFRLVLPFDLQVGRQIEFAICYRVSGQEFWDNNSGKNYIVEVLHQFPLLAT